MESRSFKEDLSAIFKTENRKPYKILLVIVFLRGMSGIYIGLFEKYISNVGTISQGLLRNEANNNYQGIFLWYYCYNNTISGNFAYGNYDSI